eukprot:TRINITY_DN6133_c0_g1_i1.p1 TRINITY_DN6133_c0_g1~~TRINITY_DN6133_c0_g1_i1.p1  ORF type:complete len:278 (+),score=82.58 TRINITY_DN6133_c0_g1_i1:67-900(+)
MADDLDDLLDDALADFDSPAPNPTTQQQSALPTLSAFDAPPTAPSSSFLASQSSADLPNPSSSSEGAEISEEINEEAFVKEFEKSMSELMQSLTQHGDLKKSLEDFYSTMGIDPSTAGFPGMGAPEAQESDEAGPSSSEAGPSQGTPEDIFRRNMMDAMKKLAEGSEELEQPAEAPGDEESFMKQIQEQLEGLSGNSGLQSAMEGMIKQLLTKDVLYEPMRDIAQKYPEWLERNRATLSPDDLERYTRQLDVVRSICQVFEQTPDNFDQIVELMQQV